MIDNVTASHRKPSAPKSRLPLAVCSLAATVPGMLMMVMRPGAQVEAVASVEPLSTSAIVPDPIAAAPMHDAPQPGPIVRADDEMAALSAQKVKVFCGTTFNGTRPHVAQVGNLLQKMFGVSDIGGANGRYDGDHGAGLALDVMTPNPALGNTIADFVLANKARFGITYVIWQQRYNDGGGWSYMEDRGSPTQNHLDHVHISFESSGAANIAC
ncbi:hypothetical protein ATK86_1423 [Nocardia fluminea]|uniref:ARB-07466-like C-terminal domain-containing protein n=2 Tax=Nocardia fluminea TaxID=134984 RepID=A0A2N3WZU7_9NOCA|nr:hypothetical protein ATK86_7364 [Nocardia fluminea]PKV99374.1 hypothetical protein ATK86_1423 [Nocardia fluminea]